MNAEDVFDKARAWDVVAAKNTEIYALKARITELEAECDRWRKGLEVIANSSTFYGSTCRELARVQLNPKAGS
jgi:hypothetical protein